MVKHYVLFFLMLHAGIRGYGQAPVSGQPLAAGTETGHFALPSLTGHVMGSAVLKEDKQPSLFLQGDARKPGIYRYWLQSVENQIPVFSAPVPLQGPYENAGSEKAVLLQEGSAVYGIWRGNKHLRFFDFDQERGAFTNGKEVGIAGLPRGFSSHSVLRLINGSYLFLFTVRQAGNFIGLSDSLYFTPEGFWPAGLPKVAIFGAVVSGKIDRVKTIEVKPLTDYDVALFDISGFTLTEREGKQYLICGTRMGNILAFGTEQLPERLGEKRYVVDGNGIIQRQPVIHASPVYYQDTGRVAGLIASGEGGIYYYQDRYSIDKNGNLVFAEPAHLLQRDPLLYGGSLVVPNLVDWDGDGVLDIVSGTSPGFILFFKNMGSNARPVYAAPEKLTAGGSVIHIQPGYREDIQGPGEARWGYSCPTVYDWNDDGLPDILIGDSRGKFMVYINSGTRTRPKLEPERPLYLDGLDMHGSWRVKPGVGKLGGRNAYIILDTDNELHLYWQLDSYNLKDGGKLTIGDSVYIKANRRPGGQVGRIKIHVTDWDNDGVKDLLIGTGRAQSLPNPVTGLPYNWGQKNEGASVLFLRNSGTEEQPVYEFPKMLKYNGKELLFGAHSCVPATGPIGSGNPNNLLVGTEYGTYRYYDYRDLEW